MRKKYTHRVSRDAPKCRKCGFIFAADDPDIGNRLHAVCANGQRYRQPVDLLEPDAWQTKYPMILSVRGVDISGNKCEEPGCELDITERAHYCRAHQNQHRGSR